MVVMEGLGVRVTMPVVLISTETLVQCRKGVQKRLRREENWLHAAAPEEKEYIEKRKENIHRLRIIRNELKKLEREL
jgi:hypothetical protein